MVNSVVIDTFTHHVNTKFKISQNFISIYFPMFNLIVYIVRGLIICNNDSIIQRAYNIFTSDNLLLTTDFEIVQTSSLKQIDENIILADDFSQIEQYTVHESSIIAEQLFSFFHTYRVNLDDTCRMFQNKDLFIKFKHIVCGNI